MYNDYEIEFFPVGDGSKAGDAIVIRYVSNNAYEVIVVDGGTEESGTAIVEHIKTVYGENTVVNHVICSHPDTDHASGLRKVLAELPVRTLWLHGVWHHAADMLPYFEDKKFTAEGLADAIRKEYPMIEELIDLASKQGAPVYEPFQGQQIGPFTVLSPGRETYLRLVPQFRKTPAPDSDALQKQSMWIQQPGLLTQFAQAVIEKAVSFVSETWDAELLRDGGVTAAENESSTVLYGNLGSAGILLTGDVGPNALSWACDHAEKLGLHTPSFSMIQIPHHGSRRNVGPTILNRLVGPILPKDTYPSRTSVVSAPKDDEKHPRKMVLNAFHRRGAGVHSTQGKRFRFHSGTMPPRPAEAQSQHLGFFDNVEDYDA